MKKYLLIAVAALAAASFVSCNKDNEVKKDKEEETEYTGPVTLCFNEISGVKKYKGIEFYNYGDKDINLKDWVVKKNNEVDGGTDAAGATTSLYWKGTEGVVKAKGFYVLHAADNDEELPAVQEGGRATGGLSPKKAIKLELIDPNGKVVDTFKRGWDDALGLDAEKTLSEVTGSFARTTDHGDTWAVLSETFGKTNVGATVISATIPQE